MIINGGKRAFWRKFAPHLMNTEKGTQQVRIVEMRGLAADNLVDAFHELEALGSGTRAKNFYYHANIDPRAEERMTEEEWEHAVDALEKNLGLDGRSRFIVEHEKNGRTHRHIVWSRVTDDMRVVPCDWNYAIHQRTADQLEHEFGHEKTPRKRAPGQAKGPKQYEYIRGKKSKIHPKEVQAELTALWHQCDSGPAFAAALGAHGYILAKGDKRDFVVIDAAGDDHSLSRRIDGASASDIRKRMADVDREALSTVAEARWLARERESEGDDKKTRSDASDHSAADKAVQGVVEEVVYSALEHAAAPHERPTPEPSREREQKTAAADTLSLKPEASVFERLARKLSEAVHVFGGGPTIAESLDGPAHPPSPLHAAPGGPEPSAFERTATELIKDAKKAAPVIEGLAAMAFAAREHGMPEAIHGLSEFERVAQQRIRDAREAGPASKLPMDPIERLGHDMMAGMREGPSVPLSAAPDAWGGQMTQAMHSKGEGRSIWERGVARLAAMRDRILDRLRDISPSFAERVQRQRDDRTTDIER